MDLLLRHALTCIFTSHNAYTTHNTWFPYISMKSGTFGTEHLCIEALSRWNAIVSRREYWKWRSGASAFELWCRASDQHMIQCDSHWDEISQVMQRVCCRSVYCIVLIMDSAKQFLDILMEFKGYCSVKEVRLHIGLDSILSPVHVWYNMIYLIQHVLVVPAAPMRYPTTVAKPVSFGWSEWTLQCLAIFPDLCSMRAVVQMWWIGGKYTYKIHIYICICIYIYTYIYVFMYIYICICIYKYFLFMYIYIYICKYIYMYVFIYTYIYVYICIYMYMYIYIYLFMYIYVYIYVYIYIYVYVCIYMYMYINVYIYIYTYIYVYICIYIYVYNFFKYTHIVRCLVAVFWSPTHNPEVFGRKVPALLLLWMCEDSR